MSPGLRRKLFYAFWAALIVSVVYVGREVMLPFVLALVVAYVLTPAVAWVEKKKVPRAAAIVLVYLVVLGSLGTFVRISAPRVAQELGGLRRELPTLGKEVQSKWVPAVQAKLASWGAGPEAPTEVKEPKDPDEPAFVARDGADGGVEIEVRGGVSLRPDHRGGYVVEAAQDEEKPKAFDVNRLVADAARRSVDYAQKNALEVAKFGQEIIRRVTRTIFVFSLTLMLAAYIMLTRERVLAFFRSLVRPAERRSFDELLSRIDRGLSGVVRGQLVICLVNGVLSAIGFALVGLKYWPVLALVATVFSLIPIFGSIMSSIPAVALGLTQGVGTAVFVLVWILAIHQLEANFLNPKIMGDAAKIHPVLVIFSLLLGEHLFHTVGALLAVPAMSVAQSLFTHFRQRVQDADPEFATEPPVVSNRPPPSGGPGSSPTIPPAPRTLVIKPEPPGDDET